MEGEKNPSEVVASYERGELSRDAVISLLTTVIENDNRRRVRVESLHLLERIAQKDEKLIKFLEGVVISDVDEGVRSASAKILVERFPDESLDTLEWALKHDLSVGCVEVILESFNDHTLRRVLEKLFSELVSKTDIKNLNIQWYVNTLKYLFNRRLLEQFTVSELSEMYLNYRILMILEEKYRLSERYLRCFNKNGYIDQLDLGGIQFKKISEIPSLDKLRKLSSLDLTQTGLTEISGLENLNKLGYLNLSWNKIREIEGLENLTELGYLDLSENQISLINGLENLKNLENLILSNNHIKNITGLQNCYKLIELYLNDNEIIEIKGLKNQILLRNLDLCSNKISRIQGLNGLKSLDSLWLRRNQISKIRGVRKLKNIDIIDLNENNIPEEKLREFNIKLEKKIKKRIFKEYKSSRLKSAKKLV